ncbi:MAG: hypothetical protein ABFE07_28180 [Armatimonadia bacterium]
MITYVCPQCHKDLGAILGKVGVPDDAVQAVVLFHAQLHWREDRERWQELLEAARQFMLHNGNRGKAYPGLLRLMNAVTALKDQP